MQRCYSPSVTARTLPVPRRTDGCCESRSRLDPVDHDRLFALHGRTRTRVERGRERLFDYLFAHTGDGRDGSSLDRALRPNDLRGAKSPSSNERGRPISLLAGEPSLEWSPRSRSKGLAVNPWASSFAGSNPAPPITFRRRPAPGSPKHEARRKQPPKRETMPHAFILRFPDGTTDQYDRVIEKMDLGGRAPESGHYHWVAMTDDGLLVPTSGSRPRTSRRSPTRRSARSVPRRASPSRRSSTTRCTTPAELSRAGRPPGRTLEAP